MSTQAIISEEDEMWMNVPTLQEAIMNAELGEFRHRQGRRYELNTVLLLSCVAMMCGAATEDEIASWIDRDGQRWLKWMGASSGRGPSAATVARVFKGTENARLQAALILWAQQVIQLLRPVGLHQWELTVVSRIEACAWLSGLGKRSSHDAIAAVSQCLSSIIETLTVSLDHRNDASRYQSLLAGLALTGCVESQDLLNHHDEIHYPVYTDRLTAPTATREDQEPRKMDSRRGDSSDDPQKFHQANTP